MFMKDIRKKQMRLAVLMEITDKPKRNSEIIKGAESRLVLDEEFNRLMKNGKQTIGSKELQFILYYIKRDKMADTPERGLYAENETTVKERLAAVSELIEYADSDISSADSIILKTETITEARDIIKNSSKADENSNKVTIIPSDGKQVEKKDRPVSTEISKDKKPKLKEKKDTAEKQVK